MGDVGICVIIIVYVGVVVCYDINVVGIGVVVGGMLVLLLLMFLSSVLSSSVLSLMLLLPPYVLL